MADGTVPTYHYPSDAERVSADPRARAEDRVRALKAQLTTEADRATMYQLLRVEDRMTDERALQILLRTWRRP